MKKLKLLILIAFLIVAVLIAHDILLQYWYLFLASAVVVFLVLKIVPNMLKSKYEIELQKLQEKRKEVQKKYFVDQNMDEESFRQLDTEIDEKFQKLKSKLEKKKMSKVK